MNALKNKNRKMEYDIKSFKESNNNLMKDIHEISKILYLIRNLNKI